MTVPDMHPPSNSTMSESRKALFTNEEETRIEEGSDFDESNGRLSAPPLLQPDPSRVASCVRPPCLKRNAALVDPVGGTKPALSSSSPSQCSAFYSFSAIKMLYAPLPRRQVHFDAAPPEACVTHSGDRYDRRPIECTQGGSQLDLSLPPRGTCSLYTDEADDEACDEEDEDEESKQERLRGFARWARLKNGGSILGGAVAFKGSTSSLSKKSSEECAEESNACTVPVHGIRSFGGLAGQSGLTDSEPHVTQQEEQTTASPMPSEADRTKLGNFSRDQESDSEERHEAFRKAVYAALSKDPNATPMPSPSVRPRWECITSYFEPSSEATTEEHEEAVQEEEEAAVAHSPARSPLRLPLSNSQEECKVASWTQDQVENEDKLVVGKAAIGLTLPPTRPSPAPSVEGGSSVTNPSSSPMSSRCSSSDAWSSSCGGGPWSGSEQDAFDTVFAKGASALSSPTSPPSSTPVVGSKGPSQALPSSDMAACLTGDEIARQDIPVDDVCVREGNESHPEVEHDQAPSSSSSGGGPGWVSSCCTSPDLPAVDMDQDSISGASAQTMLSGNSNAKEALLQRFSSFDLHQQSSERRNSIDMTASNPTPRLADRLHCMRETVSSPASGDTSPRVLSGDEEEAASMRKSSCLFRCSSKKTRKGRRVVSGDGKGDASSDDSGRPSLAPRSKSMSSASSVRRIAVIQRSSGFHNDLDDEGALGGF